MYGLADALTNMPNKTTQVNVGKTTSMLSWYQSDSIFKP